MNRISTLNTGHMDQHMINGVLRRNSFKVKAVDLILSQNIWWDDMQVKFEFGSFGVKRQFIGIGLREAVNVRKVSNVYIFNISSLQWVLSAMWQL